MVATRVGVVAVAIVLVTVLTSAASAQDWLGGYYVFPEPGRAEYVGTTDYRTAPDAAGNWSASLYPAPRPVPPQVGQVFYTYEPLYPHHYLYCHGHCYFRKGTLVKVCYSSW